MGSRGVTLPVLIVIVLIAVLGGALAGGVAGFTAAFLGTPRPAAVQAPRAAATPVSGSPSEVQLRLTEEGGMVEAARTVGPAVVTVVNAQEARTRFGQRLTESKGSGVIIDERGYIVTNEHVIRGTRELSVVLSTGQQFPARLVGTDIPVTDLAVIKIEADIPLTVASWGDSDALVPGQRVIAIGSVLGEYGNSVTQGIISGLRRQGPQSESNYRMEDLIQTDAAINRGNSGGPLVNALGQIVGINTSIIRDTQSGTIEGVGFAIPATTVRSIAGQLIERGRVVRPDMGIEYQQITRQLATFYGLPSESGVFVTAVRASSPGARAGLQEADIIVRVGDVDVNENSPFLTTLMRFQVGQTVPITIFRGNRQQVLTVTLGER